MSYTRTQGAPQTGRDATIPRFHMEPVEDPTASAKAGRPIFVQQERVQIIQPGNTNSPVLLVTDNERQRWPEQYARFKAGDEATIDGTPLEQWPFLKRNHVMELKAIGIFSVEQCAGLSDIAVQSIGMGGRSIRENAKAYLDEADQISITSAALARAESAEARIAAMEHQMAQMRPLMDQLHTENMQLKNSAPAPETYLPGAIPQMGMTTPEPVASSSLDGLSTSRKPRQRAAEHADA